MAKVQPQLLLEVIEVNGLNKVRVATKVGNVVKFEELIAPLVFLGMSDRVEVEIVAAQRKAEAECRAAVQGIKDLQSDASLKDVGAAEKRLDLALERAGFTDVEDIPEEGVEPELGTTDRLKHAILGLTTDLENLKREHGAALEEVAALKFDGVKLSEAAHSVAEECAKLKKEILELKCAAPAPEPAPGA